DVTAKAGVASAGWSTSAAFVDYDGDGALDLFVAHYLNWRPSAEVECFSLTGVPDYCSPASYDLPSAATLYHNNGNGTFTDVSAGPSATTPRRSAFARSAGRSRGSGPPSSISTTTGTSICTRRTAASACSRSATRRIPTPNRACCFAALRAPASKKSARAAGRRGFSLQRAAAPRSATSTTTAASTSWW